MFNNIFQYALMCMVIVHLLSCSENAPVVAKIDREKVYQNQVDSLISNDLKKLRKEALKIYIANKLLENDAAKKQLTVDEYEQQMIVDRAKKVTPGDIEEYFQYKNISEKDSVEIEKGSEHLKKVYQRFRFEVLIDSLKDVYNVRMLDEEKSHIPQIETDKLYSYSIGDEQAKSKVYFIADYDCPECYHKFQLINELCQEMPDRFQLHYVNYSGGVTQKAKLAEAVYNQGNYWEIHQLLFENREINDSLLTLLADFFNLDTAQLQIDLFREDMEQKIQQNQQILENASLFSVPAIIINDELFSGNTPIETLIHKIKAL